MNTIMVKRLQAKRAICRWCHAYTTNVEIRPIKHRKDICNAYLALKA